MNTFRVSLCGRGVAGKFTIVRRLSDSLNQKMYVSQEIILDRMICTYSFFIEEVEIAFRLASGPQFYIFDIANSVLERADAILYVERTVPEQIEFPEENFDNWRLTLEAAEARGVMYPVVPWLVVKNVDSVFPRLWLGEQFVPPDLPCWTVDLSREIDFGPLLSFLRRSRSFLVPGAE